jgi:hypothetical protein
MIKTNKYIINIIYIVKSNNGNIYVHYRMMKNYYNINHVGI